MFLNKIYFIIGLFNVQNLIKWMRCVLNLCLNEICRRKMQFDCNNELFTISGQFWQRNQNTMKIGFVNCKSIDFLKALYVYLFIICGLRWAVLLFELRKNEKKGVKFMRHFVVFMTFFGCCCSMESKWK